MPLDLKLTYLKKGTNLTCNTRMAELLLPNQRALNSDEREGNTKVTFDILNFKSAVIFFYHVGDYSFIV